MRKIFLIIIPLLLSYPMAKSHAQGGMWPADRIADRASDMKAMGLAIDPSIIYTEGKPSMADAVVLFDGGCTGEIVSPNGLLFTNHHCGYDLVQKLSTQDRNYLIDGFWAQDIKSELPCPGAKVEIMRKKINVTDFILSGITDSMSESDRKKKIEEQTKLLEKAYSKASSYKAVVKPYYDGNEYWVSLYEVFEDIRLVGFPPNGIGKFGGDTDNWMWPRHTGDFGIFRIYANKDNHGAKYDAANVPYRPDYHFPISTKGVAEGDFAMVYGYPARTAQYYTSYQVDQVQHVINPIRVHVRGARLAKWDKQMRKDPKIFLQYAAKQSSVSNGWKKWQGEIRGLKMNNVIEKKKIQEQTLQNRYDLSKHANADLIAKMGTLIQANNRYVAALEFIREAGLGIEIIAHSHALQDLINIYRKPGLTPAMLRDSVQKIGASKAEYFKNYDATTDRMVFDTLMPIYLSSAQTAAVPASLHRYMKQSGNTIPSWGDNIYDNSIMTDSLRWSQLIRNANPSDSAIILKDPAYMIYRDIIKYRNDSIIPPYNAYMNTLSRYSRIYTKAIMDMNAGTNKLYPDANQTLRVTYGKVKGIQPYGYPHYSYLTTLDEIIQKTNPAIEEFNTPARLIQLYNAKDYGRWSYQGTVPVAFISQNHTSGGNSGSPVLNAKGELIGINFDRVWDGVMSDLYYDPNLSRNISVDVRYVLFIIEKFGKANWLLNELTLK